MSKKKTMSPDFLRVEVRANDLVDTGPLLIRIKDIALASPRMDGDTDIILMYYGDIIVKEHFNDFCDKIFKVDSVLDLY